jgi:hypothetical protein
VRDIVGFVFFTDETGGAIWRSPNIWSVGNWVTGEADRTTDVVTIDAPVSMLGMSSKVSSRSVREKIFVANVNGRFGAVSAGYNPYPSGMRRIGGWTDQHFTTEAECRVMADLITLRQMFQYRTDTVQIPGNPAIQPDDQVRMYEEVTGEQYIHYVRSISSSWDRRSGKWTYDLQTHWLGVEPGVRWATDQKELSIDTLNYLALLGATDPAPTRVVKKAIKVGGSSPISKASAAQKLGMSIGRFNNFYSGPDPIPAGTVLYMPVDVVVPSGGLHAGP